MTSTEASPAGSAEWTGRDWIARVRHNALLFLHWRVPTENVARWLPAGVEVATFDGSAWFSLGISRVTGSRPRGVPSFLSFPPYCEAEARVPVRAGGRPGLWFVGLETTAVVMAVAGRHLMHLPYERGSVSIATDAGGTTQARSRFFAGHYCATGDAAPPAPGSRESFLWERPRMFVATRNGLRRGEEHNDQRWMVQPVQVELDAVTLPADWGLSLGLRPDAAGFVAAVDSPYSRLLPIS